MKQTTLEDSLNLVEPKVCKEMTAAGLVQGARIRVSENGKGLIVVLEIGEQQRLLGHARGRGPRYFQSFDGAASTLLQSGITEFSADTAGWTPKTMQSGSRKGKEVSAAASH